MAKSVRIALWLKVFGLLSARCRRAEKPDRAELHRGQGHPHPAAILDNPVRSQVTTASVKSHLGN